jgi:hypothetical protein
MTEKLFLPVYICFKILVLMIKRQVCMQCELQEKLLEILSWLENMCLMCLLKQKVVRAVRTFGHTDGLE